MTWSREQADREAAERAFADVEIVEGVARWTTNGACPFPDMMAHWITLGLTTAEVAAATEAARQADQEAFFGQYRRARATRTAAERAEEQYELRAAFGPGQRVVDVITGETTIT